jgi:8-oxo-dGTP pyrophosphatase MutT (NUDIX family)
MPRDPIPTWYFALVVVRQGNRFLLVHERKHGQGWYLPAGRVESGETLTQAAVRETLEETGVPVVLDGVLRVEHSGGGSCETGIRPTSSYWTTAPLALDEP